MSDLVRTQYGVSISNIITADSPEDAVRQMYEWLVMEGGALNGVYNVEDDSGRVHLVDLVNDN